MNAKQIFTVLAAFALFLASSGCNAQSKQENTNTITQSNNNAMNKIVIFFSHAGDNYVVGDNGANYITNIEVGNTLIQQTAIEPILAEFGTRMMAWGPLGGQGVEGIVKSEELAAIGAKYGKSAAQVALRWLTQRGVVAIPKSSHKERMAQNFDIFDFTLTADDMAAVAKLNQHDTGTIDFGDPQFVKYLIENYG